MDYFFVRDLWRSFIFRVVDFGNGFSAVPRASSRKAKAKIKLQKSIWNNIPGSLESICADA